MFTAITRAAGDHVEWMIVEIDWAAMDMIEAVELSYQFMVSEGMAWGRVDVASWSHRVARDHQRKEPFGRRAATKRLRPFSTGALAE